MTRATPLSTIDRKEGEPSGDRWHCAWPAAHFLVQRSWESSARRFGRRGSGQAGPFPRSPAHPGARSVRPDGRHTSAKTAGGRPGRARAQLEEIARRSGLAGMSLAGRVPGDADARSWHPSGGCQRMAGGSRCYRAGENPPMTNEPPDEPPPAMFGLPPSARGLAARPPTDPADHAEDFSRRYAEDLDIVAGQAMLDFKLADGQRVPATPPGTGSTTASFPATGRAAPSRRPDRSRSIPA